MLAAGGVGVVLRERAIGDYEDLHVFKQPRSGPEAVPLVTVDLVKGFADVHPTALELDMHERQTVDQHCDVVPV